MAFKLKGKEEKFFSILENHAALTYESAEMMERVFKGEISKEEAFLEIDTKEKAADELVTETVERLRKTFITPMDREDIQLLIDNWILHWIILKKSWIKWLCTTLVNLVMVLSA